MVIIDTSIWIGQFRRAKHSSPDRLLSLAESDEAAICGQVWIEFLSGFRNDRQRTDFAADLSFYPWLETDRSTYALATDWRARHPSLGVGDAIIAATAFMHKASVLTMDKDFLMVRPEGLEVELLDRL